jgi:flagellar hook-associated protein 2
MSMSSISSTTLRLSGLQSGIDTDAVVKAMLTADQTRLDKQFQQKTKLEWKLDVYRQMKTELKAFAQKYMSALSTDHLWTASALKVNKVTVSSSAVTITAGTTAKTGSMTIDSITQLARGAQADSTGGVATGEGLTSYNTALKDLALTTGFTFVDGSVSFRINGKDFTFSEDTTLQDMMNTINADADANVTLSYSQLTNSFTLESDTMGSASSLTVENFTGNAFGDGVTPGALGLNAGTYANGRDAILSINGVAVTRNTNTFTIDGITYKLNKATGEAIDFSVEQDVDTVVSRIRTFVDEYNALVKKYNGYVTESVYRDYPPLTDAQRDEMTDKEIEEWEKKAKSGLLRSDNDLSNMLSQFRLAFSTTVEGTGMSMASIGLTTAAFSVDGQIQIDTDALKKALTNDPDAVVKLFTQSSTATGSEKFNQSGLMQRLSATLNTYINDIQAVSVDTTEDRIKEIEDKMDQLESVMAANEERYYARFTAMEQALAKLNSQSSWLSSLFAQQSTSG